MTHIPICGECSTRYEGVNYSSEGLRLLQQQRAAGRGSNSTAMLMSVLAILLSPLLIYLMYLSFAQTADLLIDLLH